MGDQALKQVYGDKRFSYISYRKYDYNVNPLEHLNCNLDGQLKGFALVCRNEASKKTAEFEKAFSKGGYKILRIWMMLSSGSKAFIE